MRRIGIALISAALAVMGLIGTATPANASCHVIAEELGCVESIPCRAAAKVGVTMNCLN